MMTRLLPCLAVATATATTTRVTMDDEPAFFAAALARDDAAARWRAEASRVERKTLTKRRAAMREMAKELVDCDATCQHDHSRRGHKQICEKIRR